MINLNVFIDDLKSTWIRRLLISNYKWLNLLSSDIELDQLGGCNVKYAENVLTNIQNKFWKDVLQANININKKNSLKEDMVLQTLL